MDNFNFSAEEESAMKEAASIGMGHASIALEQLLNKRINIDLPKIEHIEVNALTNLFPDNDILFGVIINVLGNIKGKVLYLFKKNDWENILNLLHSNNDDITVTEDLKVSMMKEVANILTASYVSSLSKFASISIIPSLPHLAMDTANSIFDLAASDEDEMHVILLRSKLRIQDGEAEAVGSLILQLTSSELEKLMTAIKDKYNN